MTSALVYHAHAEAVLTLQPPVKAYHVHAEAVLAQRPAVKAYHLHAEAVIGTHPPAKVYHLHAEAIVALPVTDPTLAPIGATEDGRLGYKT